MPDFNNTFIEGTTDVTALGDLIEAGLPNIEGNISGLLNHGQFQGSGALSSTELSGSATCGYNNTGQYAAKIQKTSFDASLSNPIYGNSTTVQPPAIKVFILIKY